MPGFLENFAEKQFRKLVHQILVANVPEFEDMEGVLPHSTVETAYKNAWVMFGKQAHDKCPSVYQEAVANAAQYIAEFHAIALRAFSGQPP